MKYKFVIYDLDGTLLDTTEGILESIKYAAIQLGYCELPHEILLKFIGPPIQESYQKYYNCDKQEAQIAANIFRDYYKNKSLLKAKPYEGIFELCNQLKKTGMKQAVATYKREDYALELLTHFGFHNYMNAMHGADNNNILSKSDIIRLCMKEMRLTNTDCVYIGDTEKDVISANEIGLDFIGVTYGFGFKTKEDLKPYPNIGVVNSVGEIIQLLK